MKGYLDAASAVAPTRAAWRAFISASKESGNPSSPHAYGARAKHILDTVRISVARIAGIKPDGVIFTAGATEANNLAIQGYLHGLISEGKKWEQLHVLYAPTCHSSVVKTMQAMIERGVLVEALEVTVEGTIDLLRLAKQIRPETVLVSMDLVCGETGTVWHTRDVRRVLDTARTNIAGSKILLLVDGSQAPLVESIEMNRLGADLLTLDAQKIGGVRGIGALLRTSAVIKLDPILFGGGQEQGLRPGTENPALASAFAVALKDAQEGRESFRKKSVELQEKLIARLIQSMPMTLVNRGRFYSPYVLNLSFPGLDTDYAVMLLSEAGYAVSTKSACETNQDGSRVVLTLTGDLNRARSTLRISWSPSVNARALRSFATKLLETLAFLQTN